MASRDRQGWLLTVSEKGVDILLMDQALYGVWFLKVANLRTQLTYFSSSEAQLGTLEE